MIVEWFAVQNAIAWQNLGRHNSAVLFYLELDSKQLDLKKPRGPRHILYSRTIHPTF